MSIHIYIFLGNDELLDGANIIQDKTIDAVYIHILSSYVYTDYIYVYLYIYYHHMYTPITYMYIYLIH
jgi:hypothetical protein